MLVLITLFGTHLNTAEYLHYRSLSYKVVLSVIEICLFLLMKSSNVILTPSLPNLWSPVALYCSRTRMRE